MLVRSLIAVVALAGATASQPEITTVTPVTPLATGKMQTLTVAGHDFLPGLSVEVRGYDGQTSVVTGSAITVRNSMAFDMAVTFTQAGSYDLKVTNKDGGVSQPFTVQVRGATPATPTIVIDRVVPDAPNHADQEQTLHLEGRNLDGGIAVVVTDPSGADVPNVTVGKASPTSVDVTLLLSQRGDYALQASNAAGATSNRVIIRVQ